MATPNFWGNLIFQLREEQDVSQRTLAYLAKVSRHTLRRLEAGNTPGSVAVLERLLRCLGYDLEAIKSKQFLRLEHKRKPRNHLLLLRGSSIDSDRS